MSKRNIFIIILVIFIIIATIAVYYAFFAKTQSEPEVQVQKQAQRDIVDTEIGQKIDVAGQEKVIVETGPPTEEEVAAASHEVVARAFVERFGTYSNHSDYKSIEELIPMMTSGMANWVEKTYLPKLRADYPSDAELYKIKTMAPVANILKQTESAVEIMLSCQRTETKSGQENQFLQDIKIELKKQGNNWLVNAAYWQD